MDDIDALVASVHEHLEATEQRPLETEANRWLGEAQAIAADIDDGNVDEETIQERTAKILDLLSEVEGTGDKEADEHVAAARRAAERILDR